MDIIGNGIGPCGGSDTYALGSSVICDQFGSVLLTQKYTFSESNVHHSSFPSEVVLSSGQQFDSYFPVNDDSCSANDETIACCSLVA